MAEHNDLGKWGEDEAALYLEDEGYTIIDRDWRLGRRDLDILAYTPDGNTLVVVEVKTRTGEEYQQPEEAVTPGKMRNLAIAANAYVKGTASSREPTILRRCLPMLPPMPRCRRLHPERTCWAENT